MSVLDEIIESGPTDVLYQPIARLETGEIVGYEALMRGPAGSGLERPEDLFALARIEGRLWELDLACRRATFSGAREARLPQSMALFVNVEADALGYDIPPALRERLVESSRGLHVIIEITERALTTNPSRLFRGVENIRNAGWGIAVDDVGSTLESLAIMPLLRPDVIKLDLPVVQQQPNPTVARIMSAVIAESERTGATVLAEGVETRDHLDMARSLGATLGQGWLFGSPEALPTAPPLPVARIPLLPPMADPRIPTSPFDLVRWSPALRWGSKHLMMLFSRYLEEQAFSRPDPSVVLAGLQDESFFTPFTRRRYEALAQQAAFVGVFAAGMGNNPAPGIRGAGWEADHPLRDEWHVQVLGPHFAGALMARTFHDDAPDPSQPWAFAVTFDRTLVLRAMRTLMARTEPADPSFEHTKKTGL